MAKKVNRPGEEQNTPSRRPFEPLHPPQRSTPAAAECSSSPAIVIESQHLEMLFRLSCDGIVLHELTSETARDYFLQANEAICRLLGYSLEEMRRLTPLDILAPEELSKLPADTAVMQREGVLVHEKTLLAKDGRRIPVEISSRLFEHAGKQMAISTIRDITKRKQTEEQLRDSEQRLEEVVEAQTEQLRDSVDRLQNEVARRVLAEAGLRKQSRMLEAFFRHTITPLAFLDRNFRYVRVNEAYARVSGTAPEMLVGTDYFALHPDPRTRTIFEQVVSTHQPYSAHARPHVPPDDPEQRLTYWNWRLTPLLSDAGEVQFLVLNLEDVTKEQTALQELEHRAGQLQKLTLELSQAEDSERKRLADLLHDDLQQILAAAKFHVGLLQNQAGDKSVVQDIAGQLKQMLKEAIEKSRSLSHELSPVFYQVDLADVLDWLAGQMQSRHGLTVHVEVRGPVGLPSDAMKAFLYKAAHEMLFNVVKHAGVNEATLRLRRMRGRLWLTISDQGRGFDPKTLSRTSGFGLLTIRERVELLGGRVRIKSTRSRGSTFLLAVPDVAAPAATAIAEPVIKAAAQSPNQQTPFAKRALDGGLRVLLVDDQKIVREGLTALLTGQPDINIVGQAANGQEAVELAQRLTPDVVVMDVAMPLMGGDEATRLIKQHLPQTRVIALSMHEEPHVAGRMRNAGAEDYVLKTASAAELFAAIRGRKE